MNIPVQKIVFGSPGTGKSHLVDSVIISKELSIDVSKNPENVIKTVFHPEYTNSDFIGKLLPITRSGKVEYKFYDGHFLRALGQAYKNYIKAHDKAGNLIESSKIENVVLVIDEINRGNSSAIFGGVFQLLDRDDSGWSSYCININEIAFMKILELIGVSCSYDSRGDVEEYKLKPHDGVKTLETLQKKIDFLKFDLINKTIKLPPNLSVIATMNTSDNSIYYMDSAFKRRWDWEFVDINSTIISASGIAFEKETDWINFIGKLNSFIKSNHKYIRGIEDKQIGRFFIRNFPIKKASIQSKLMFFLWDSVFSRDKKPLSILIDSELITFGDFAEKIDIFIDKIKNHNV